MGRPYFLFLQDAPTVSSKSSIASNDGPGRSKPGSGGAARMTQLNEQQKQDISNMASPACMESAERKRQYAAMGRAIVKSCSPSLLAKYQLCSDTERCGSGHKSPIVCANATFVWKHTQKDQRGPKLYSNLSFNHNHKWEDWSVKGFPVFALPNHTSNDPCPDGPCWSSGWSMTVHAMQLLLKNATWDGLKIYEVTDTPLFLKSHFTTLMFQQSFGMINVKW